MSNTPTPVKALRGFAAMTPEQRLAAQQKSAVTRLANRQAAAAKPTPGRSAQQLRIARAASAPQAGAPPEVPENYGRLPEAGSGGAIDPATHSIGGLGENDPAVQGRPLAPDIVGLEPESVRPRTRVAHREDELPFHKERQKQGAVAPPTRMAPAVEEGGIMLVLPNWETVELREGQDALDAARQLLEDGARRLQSRVSSAEAEAYACIQCGRFIPDLRQAKMIQARRDPGTGIITNDVWCSARCYTAGIAAGQFAPAAAKG